MRLTFSMIVLAGAVLGAGAFAAEPVPGKPPATPNATPAAPAAKPAQKAADEIAAAEKAPAEQQDDAKAAAEPAPRIDDAKTAAEKAAAKPADAKASPQRFIPSEQVRADFDVSFPIDI